MQKPLGFCSRLSLANKLNSWAHPKSCELLDGALDPSVLSKCPRPSAGPPRSEQWRVRGRGCKEGKAALSRPPLPSISRRPRWTTFTEQSQDRSQGHREKGDEGSGTLRGALGPANQVLGHSAQERPGGGARSGQGTWEGKDGEVGTQVRRWGGGTHREWGTRALRVLSGEQWSLPQRS